MKSNCDPHDCRGVGLSFLLFVEYNGSSLVRYEISEGLASMSIIVSEINTIHVSQGKSYKLLAKFYKYMHMYIKLQYQRLKLK